MTVILALDASTRACSAAVAIDGKIFNRIKMMERGHASALLPMVAEVMTEAGVGFADLDALATTVGPGGFTGVRIGLSAARGLALATGAPCFGVSTLATLAAAVDREETGDRVLVAAIDTRRGDFYVEFTPPDGPAGPPMAASVEEIAIALGSCRSVSIVGDGAADLACALERFGVQASVSAAPPHPQAAVVTRIAARRFASGERPTVPPRSLYLRAPLTGPALPIGVDPGP